VLDAVVTVVLGCVFWTTSPRLGQWFFDLAVGISLIMRGAASAMFGLALIRPDGAAQKQVPATESTQPNTSAQNYRFRVNHFR
jgi:hypothetical protein